AGIVRPERTVEVQSLDSRPLKSLVQVGVPIRPELHHIEEGLDDSLLLVIATWRPDGHERLAIPQHDTRCQRVSWPGAWPKLRGARLVEPKLLAANTHSDARVAKDDRTSDPATARRAVEDVAVLVDDGDVGCVLGRTRHWLRIRHRSADFAAIGDV